eukprot:12405629-Karenia_brevis.AAC.1
MSYGHFSVTALHVRLVDGATNDGLSGYPHNAVTPLAIWACKIQIANGVTALCGYPLQCANGVTASFE